ncbi:hypothetical protein UA08_06087 [Talaromyces atroroseus]|uniref:BZIP domain-containing protein n=1 Tax=Talaromyces atroroseus TaxID=1441469 RepID=A0A225AGT5_TALAT|nr:hypothetical protein UA08_06087 [Talaromyces atroroseus]OKL58403.1 hypothetical protein UA08_06087 [Talaromyces atroroseus]
MIIKQNDKHNRQGSKMINPRVKKRKSAKIRASKPAKSTTPAITPTTSSEVDSTAPRTAIDRVPAGRERRRIQMRIAQRAYRQRKQDEIYSRQKQLSERDCLIAQMKTAFDALSSRLVDLDVLSFYPDLSQPVQDMAQAFEALAQMKSATGSTAAAPAPAPAPASTATAETKDTDTGLYSLFGGFEQQQWTDIHDFGGDISSGQQQLSMGITVPPPYVTAGLRQAYNLQDFSNHYLHGQSQSHQFQQFTGNNERHYGSTTTTSSVASTGINDLKIPISMDIKPPTSYAFQETTFARRLMRVCTEAAYRVLMSGDLPSASSKEARVFKLAYRLWSKKYLVEKFQLALSSGDPSVPTIPFVSLGGAGTHYIHATMDQQPDKSAMPVASGPMAIHIAHIRHDGAGTSLDGIMSSLGLLNDEWFDALDVDLYLRSMGINLEAHSTNHRFLLPANPDVASKVVATSRAMGGSAQGVNLQDYVPAVVNVDRFMDCKTFSFLPYSPPPTPSFSSVM